MKTLFLFPALFLIISSTSLFSQVEMDKPIQMTGSTDADRTITNLSTPVNPTDAANKAYVDAAASGSSCPSGSVSAGAYCVETNERSGATWFVANVTCGDLGGKLCTWGEWYYACQKTSLGLSNMTNNNEWIDEAVSSQSNSNTNYINLNSATKIVGNGTCTANSNASVTGTSAFRCCYKK